MKTQLADVQVYTYDLSLPTDSWSERYSTPHHLDKAVLSHLKRSTVFNGTLLQSQTIEILCMINFRNVKFS